MSEEKPRLSRREMRERGLLRPVTDGPSPVEELSRTQEISLNRMSRKEMRERERASQATVDSEVEAAKQEAARRATEQRAAEEAARKAAAERATAEAAARAAANRERIAKAQRAEREEQAAATREREQAEQAAAKASADLEAAEVKIAEQAAADKAAATDRRSVFDRFTGDSGSSPAPSHSAQSANTGFSAATGYSAQSGYSASSARSASAASAPWAESPESDDANASLEERLLDRMRSGGFSLAASSPEELRDGETGAAAASETSATSEGFAPEAPNEPHTLGEAVAGTAGVREEPEGSESDLGTGVPRASKSAQEWTAAEDIESEYDADDLQEDKGHGVLMTLIGILIGIVLGIIVGFGLRYLYVNVLSLGVDLPAIVASAQYITPLF